MRFFTTTLKFLPLFNRHKTVWAKAMEYKKQCRKAKKRNKDFNESCELHLVRAREQMKSTKCPFFKNNGCITNNCVHFLDGKLTTYPVVRKSWGGEEYYDTEYTPEYTTPKCKLWK
jgi:hypothetical protein